MSREKREAEVDGLCDEAGCSEKIRKIHFEQYVHRNWHPHPPREFVVWWGTQDDCRLNEIDAKRAYNCKFYYEQFLEAKTFGVV